LTNWRPVNFSRSTLISWSSL